LYDVVIDIPAEPYRMLFRGLPDVTAVGGDVVLEFVGVPVADIVCILLVYVFSPFGTGFKKI
jgi:hypothetical protein